MAGDNLNEVGKYLKKTRKDVDYALGRYLQRRSRVEGTRDVFSSELSFIFYFDTEDDESTTLDITFRKPPPGGNFGTGSCEAFTIGLFDKIFTTSTNYEEDSVTVFLNDAELPNSEWYEYDVEAHQVFVKGGPFSDNAVVICYVRA